MSQNFSVHLQPHLWLHLKGSQDRCVVEVITRVWITFTTLVRFFSFESFKKLIKKTEVCWTLWKRLMLSPQSSFFSLVSTSWTCRAGGFLTNVELQHKPQFRDFVLTKACLSGSFFFGNATYPREVGWKLYVVLSSPTFKIAWNTFVGIQRCFLFIVFCSSVHTLAGLWESGRWWTWGTAESCPVLLLIIIIVIIIITIIILIIIIIVIRFVRI